MSLCGYLVSTYGSQTNYLWECIRIEHTFGHRLRIEADIYFNMYYWYQYLQEQREYCSL